MTRIARPALIALGLLVAFAVVETAGRLALPNLEWDRFLWRMEVKVLNSAVDFEASKYRDGPLGYRLPASRELRFDSPHPYTASINSAGFRTRELARPEEETYRVAVIGDSMLFGVGVSDDETLAACLEDRAKEGNTRLEAFNLAVVGYNPVQYFAIARDYVPLLEPDLVVVGLFVANDILPAALAGIDGSGNYASLPAELATFRGTIEDQLPLGGHTVSERVVDLALYGPRLRYRLTLDERWHRPAIEWIAASRAIAEESEADFAVLLLHGKDAVTGGLRSRWSGSVEAGAEIARQLRARGIRVVDLLEHLRGADAFREHHIPEDGHPNAAGNRRLAEILWSEAVATGSLPVE